MLAPAPSLATRTGRDLRRHRWTGRGGRLEAAVHVPACVCAPAQLHPEHAHSVLDAPGLVPDPKCARIGCRTPEGTLQLREHVGELPHHPLAMAARGVVGDGPAALASPV